MDISSSVLIIGCGDLGIRLAKRLQVHNWRVLGLRRTPQASCKGIEMRALDLNAASVEAWPCEAFGYWLYCVSADRGDEAAYRAAYVEGLRQVKAQYARATHKPKHLLFVSSTSVYGQDDGQWVDEQSLCEPANYTGQIMREAEQLALSIGPCTVVRLAGLYDPARPWLIEQVRQGLQVAREPVHYANRIHRDDAAALLAHLLLTHAQGLALDEVYLGVDDAPAPLYEVVQWLRQGLGVQHETGNGMSRRAGSKRCSNKRARALGWAPSYPSYREGYASALGRPEAD